MQDQGKRLLIAVSAALAFMLVWNMLFPSKPDDQQATNKPGSGSEVVKSTTPGFTPGESATGTIDNKKSAPDVKPTTPSEPGTTPTPSEPPPATAAPVEAARGPEKLVPLKFPNLEATFSNYGGSIVGWKLTDPRYQ